MATRDAIGFEVEHAARHDALAVQHRELVHGAHELRVTRRDEMGVLAQSALMKEESAVRLYERSRKSAEAEEERRSDANRPHRARAGMRLRLIEGGAPGLHFYTLNLAKPTVSVLKLLQG